MWINVNRNGWGVACNKELAKVTDKTNNWITYTAGACGFGLCMVVSGTMGFNIYMMIIGTAFACIGGIGLIMCGMIHSFKVKKIISKYRKQVETGNFTLSVETWF